MNSFQKIQLTEIYDKKCRVGEGYDCSDVVDDIADIIPGGVKIVIKNSNKFEDLIVPIFNDNSTEEYSYHCIYVLNGIAIDVADNYGHYLTYSDYMSSISKLNNNNIWSQEYTSFNQKWY